MRCIPPLLLLFVSAVLFGAGVEEEPASETELLLDTRSTYKVVVAGVVLTEILPEFRPLTGSLPGIVRNSLEGYDRRTIDPDERMVIAARIQREALGQEERSRAELKGERDRNALLGRDTEDQDQRLAEVEKRLSSIRTADLRAVDIPDSKPVEYVTGEYESFVSLRYPATLLRRFDADLVIYIEAESLDPYMMVRIMAVDRAREEVEEITRFAALPDEVATSMEKVASDVQEYIIGAPFASLIVTVRDGSGATSETTELYVDGSYVGSGAATVDTLLPGTHVILARTSWGGVYQTSAMVTAGDTEEVEIELPELETGTIRVQSTPSGASVYQGVEWLGKTPLSVERPDTYVQYEIRSPGFLESRFVANPASGSSIGRSLIPDTYDWEEHFTESRNRFYRSFGFFLGSVVVPVVINGAFMNRKVFIEGWYATSPTSDEMVALQPFVDETNSLVYGYYGSIAVSGFFLGNMIRRLSQFIRIGQEYHER